MSDHEWNVKFAEAMGWSRIKSQLPLVDGEYRISEDRLFRCANGKMGKWDPHTNRNDADELAEKLDIRYSRDPDDFKRVDGKVLIYSAWSGGDSWHYGSNLCEAICEAAKAMIEASS